MKRPYDPPVTTTLVSPTPSLTAALPADPLEVVRRWPGEWPLMALCSGAAHERWGRWTILARPRGWFTHQDGRSELVGFAASARSFDRPAFTHEPLHDLDRLLVASGGVKSANGQMRDNMGPPFRGGWIGAFAYELGFDIEPAARVAATTRVARGAADWPLIELAWCPDALIFEYAATRWWTVGDVAELIAHLADASSTLHSSPGRGVGGEGSSSATPDFHAGPLSARPGAAAYVRAVQRALEYIRAGDIFQANIAQQYCCDFRGSSRSLFRRAMEVSGARYGALIESPAGRAIISMSPELFLQVDGATRRIITRPIKGTRPVGHDPAALAASGKDAAELHMIVDLMRNDLGRICSFGSVRVNEARLIETYPTVHHGVAEVSGTLRPEVSLGDVLRAAFPPGSVTGAPKVRAMQVIDELEAGTPRGPYCGAIGFIDSTGGACLNVGIRTMMLEGPREPGRFDAFTHATLTYGAGCGIVADSTPEGELAECEDKTAVLRAAIGG